MPVDKEGAADGTPDAFLLHFASGAFFPAEPDLIGVAVSGGSDSMAMLHLLVRHAADTGQQIHAVTVDHRLRPEAADEAKFVAGICAGLGVSHDTLVWKHGVITGNLQDQARRARYGLIAGWAKSRGIDHVAIGHTADDQAETFLMGLARSAGIDGLSGMRRRWSADGVDWSRPFLLQSRADLRGYLLRHGVPWVDDPSNTDDHYTRVRARKVMKALKPLGITVDRLSDVIHNLGEARDTVVRASFDALNRISRAEAGMVLLDRRAFLGLPNEIGRRVMVAALAWVSGAPHPPRESALFNLLMTVSQCRDATLSGCRIRMDEAEIRITREPRAVAGQHARTDATWDGRWRLDGPHDPALEVRALGAEGLRTCKDWRVTGILRDALLVSPAVWRGNALIAAPLAGMPAGWSAKITPDWPAFILSH